MFLSQGVPMICAGDEMGRTQRGNNNAFCQDNELSWVHWDLRDDDRALLEFTRRVIRLMRDHPALRRRKFLQGRAVEPDGPRDVTWLAPGGGEMSDDDWNAEHLKSIGVAFAGGEIGEVDDQGAPITDVALTILLNADPADVLFVLPDSGMEGGWECQVDTGETGRELQRVPSGQPYTVTGRSVVMLRAATPRHAGTP
jgi:glycogen operon protein